MLFASACYLQMGKVTQRTSSADLCLGGRVVNITAVLELLPPDT